MDEIKFQIDYNTWKKLLNFAQATFDAHKSEVSGYMTLTANEDGYIMENPELLLQEVSGMSTEIEGNSIQKYITKYLSKLGHDIKFVWWHTHPEFGTSFSVTDDTTINATPHKNLGDFATSLCINLKGDYNMRVTTWNPFKYDHKQDLTIINTPDVPKIPQYILTEVEKNVKKSVYNYSKQKYPAQKQITGKALPSMYWSNLTPYYHVGTNLYYSSPQTRKQKTKHRKEENKLSQSLPTILNTIDLFDDIHAQNILGFIGAKGKEQQTSCFNILNKLDCFVDQTLTEEVKFHVLIREISTLNKTFTDS